MDTTTFRGFRPVRKRIGLGLALILALGLPAVADERSGWHGEAMPGGLSRGEVEGEYLWARDQSVMVFVPAGKFEFGSDFGPADELPIRKIWLDGYYIDKYEVSWRQWKLSGLEYTELQHSRLSMPEAPSWGIHDDHPMVEVNWHDAMEYARWAGKQLPSEAQWEKAARGTEGRLYPWGDDPVTAERAVYRRHPIAQVGTAPVDCCEAGVSPYGVYNMAGNVYEWCRDVYDAGWYDRAPDRNPVNLEEGDHRVLRGGAFPFEVEDQRSAYRYRLLPIDRTPYIGFRTVVPLAEETEN